LSPGLFALFAVSYSFRVIALGLAYHRYFAHRAFRTSRAMQFGLAVLGSLSTERGPVWWAATHRAHHRFADTPQDIHSPRRQGFLYSYFWFLDRRFKEADLSCVPDLAKYPELVQFDRWGLYHVPVVGYGLAMYALAGWQGFVWGFCLSTVAILHVTHWIQSISHSFGGYRRFETDDASRNHWFIGVVTFGEWHNNHHHHPSAARQGVAWWEFDLNYAIVRGLERLGLVWDVRRPAPIGLRSQ